MHRIIFPALLLSTLLAASMACAQTPLYYCAPLYSMPDDTSVPPLYPGQPSQVTTAYLWLDDLMRLEPEGPIEQYISSLHWNDTAQTIASNLYQIQDDNPVTYFNWDGVGIHPNPYKGVTGQAEVAFTRQVSQIETTGVAYVLLSSLIISDVTVSDTVWYHDPTALSATDAVLANCTINDEIKGKRVPACFGGFRAGRTGTSTLGVATTATSAFPPDTARAGTCLQFQYSPEWKLNPINDLSHHLGGWIKPGHEYIVFLSFAGVGYNSTQGFFTTEPVGFGNNCGMYPVVAGIVQDPHDDFGLGGPNLPLATWKAALRAKISALIIP